MDEPRLSDAAAGARRAELRRALTPYYVSRAINFAADLGGDFFAAGPPGSEPSYARLSDVSLTVGGVEGIAR